MERERQYTPTNEGVIGVFHSRQEAERCIDALLDAGFDRNQMSIVMRGGEEREKLTRDTGVKETHAAEGATSGAGAGAVLGGAAGLLVGLGLLAVPGIGPLLAMGPIATTLAGAGIGGVSGGVVGALVGLGIPEPEAKRYAEEIKEGSILVTVRCDGQCDRARSVLSSYAAYDVRTFTGRRTGEGGTPETGEYRYRREPGYDE